MARERLADLDESKEDERERKLKLQEKNRRAQQAFRWRQKSKIQELSDQVTELTTKNGSNIIQMQELQREKSILEEALTSQAAQLQRLSSEYMLMRARSVSNMFLPSSTLQFDPSEDVLLKYPASTSDGCAEHVLLPSSEIQLGTGMEKLRELMQQQWLPELKDLSKECDDVMEKKRANSHGSSRTKQARQEEANKALDSIDERCRRIQILYYECLVKIIRAQPVRARMLISNVLYNCNASLSPQEVTEKATKVLDELDLSNTEIEQTCRMYEKFLCNMALLRWQREKMMQQVATTYKLSDEDWLAQVASEQGNIQSFLSASAAIESMYIWLRKETELYCDLITSVCLEIWRPTTFMRQITAAAPGMVDFFAMLETLRSRHKPQEKVLDIATAYTQSAITPRTMSAAADGHVDAVASLRVSTGVEASPRSLADLGLGTSALPANVLAQATSGLPNPRMAVEAAREAEELLSKAKHGGRDFWAGPGNSGASGDDSVKKMKLTHEGSCPSAVLPKLERSQLLTLPPHATGAAASAAGSGAATAGAATAFSAGGAGPPAATQPCALLSLAEPSACLNVSSSIASGTTSPMGCSGPVLPPLPLNNLNRNIADISWLTHSSLTPREQEFTDFLSGMLSNRAPLPSPGRVSTIDILRVRSNSQVGEIELIQAQASIQQQVQAQGQGLQVGNGNDVIQQPQLQVNSLHLLGAHSQLNRLAQEGLLGNIASALPQNNGQPGGSGAPGSNMTAAAATFSQLQGKPMPGIQQARARRTPEELAASYQAFMGEAL